MLQAVCLVMRPNFFELNHEVIEVCSPKLLGTFLIQGIVIKLLVAHLF